MKQQVKASNTVKESKENTPETPEIVQIEATKEPIVFERVDQIKKALGHKNTETTETYLDSFKK